MTVLQEMPRVHECTATECGYNHDVECHAAAITIGGDHAHCGTFIPLGTKGGIDVRGTVGACHRAECRHNDELECHAPSIQVGASQDVADCLTYEPA